MDLNFDSNGNLAPSTNIKCSLQLFQETFVKNTGSKKRQDLFNNFELYINALKKITGGTTFIVWINGSFVTKRSEPNDFDAVIFLDYTLVKTKKHQLVNFKYPISLSKFGLDAYIVVVYPSEHVYHSLFISDKTYWMDLFTKNKRNRKGRKTAKGFVEINI